MLDPDIARALVIVDIGPELSHDGTKVISEFVAHNVEFDDLEVFLDNVTRYDPFRAHEHVARTVKYNLMQRVDGKYVSKVDHRRIPCSDKRPLALDDRCRDWLPVLVVRGGESDVLPHDAAQRFDSGASAKAAS